MVIFLQAPDEAAPRSMPPGPMTADMDKHPPSVAEFPRPVAVDRLEQGELAQRISANEYERRALAERFGLQALEGLSADVTLSRIGHGPVVRVEGHLAADVVQTCVVSLEPVESRIEEDFAQLYAPERRPDSRGHVIEAGDGSDAEDDWPEPILDGRIDIGEAVAQQLALALNPYPRKPGVRLEDVIGNREGIGVDEPPAKPFAALAQLARRGPR